MADIRCIVCNRVNDSNDERCWYCQSILPKPLEIPGSKKSATHAGDADEPVVASLDSLHSAESGAAEPPQEVVPEWLARIRALKRQEMGIEEPITPPFVPEEQNAEETPDEFAVPIDEVRKYDLDQALVAPVLDASHDSETPAVAVLRGEDDEIKEGGIQTESLAASDAEEETRGTKDESPLELETNSADKPGLQETLFVDDLPDWLTAEVDANSNQLDDTRPEEMQMPSAGDATLEPGHLPAWLQAIKPRVLTGKPRRLSRIGDGDSTSRQAAAGGEDLLDTLHAPVSEILQPGVPGGIKISEAQARNVELFSNLLSPQGSPVQKQSVGAIKGARRPLVRSLVIILLLLSVLVPLFDPDGSGVQPVLFPAEVVDTFLVLQGMPDAKPVLVVSQFEPGLAGELRLVIRPVLEDLVSRSVPLVVVSTNPTSYAILQDEFAKIALDGFSAETVNLGYLPGGTIGMISLVDDLRQALPLTTDLMPAWESEFTRNVDSLEDFGALLLVTDNAETSRGWIEQTGTSAATPPVIVLSSAQIAPMLQPYYASRQIDGFVAGINNSLVYGKIRQKPVSAVQLFGSFQLALLVSALIILIGGIANLIFSPAPPSKQGVKR